jgi:hypothetical protein
MSRDSRKLTGYYARAPVEMLEYAIQKSLTLAATMVAAGKRQRAALLTVARDQALAERAARIVLGVMLSELRDEKAATKSSMDRLVEEIAALAKES